MCIRDRRGESTYLPIDRARAGGSLSLRAGEFARRCTAHHPQFGPPATAGGPPSSIAATRPSS
eukprot:4430095-Prymnesium_polylepis.1